MSAWFGKHMHRADTPDRMAGGGGRSNYARINPIPDVATGPAYSKQHGQPSKVDSTPSHLKTHGKKKP